MSDGVWFDGVHDALIITVNPSLIWLEHDVHNDEGKCSCSEKQTTEEFYEMVSNINYVGRNVAFGEVRWMHRLLSVIYDAWPQPRLSLITQSRNKVDSGLLRLMFEGKKCFGITYLSCFLQVFRHYIIFKVGKWKCFSKDSQIVSPSLWTSTSKITVMKTTHKEKKKQKNIQHLNVRVEMHSKELQKYTAQNIIYSILRHVGICKNHTSHTKANRHKSV